MPFALIPDGYKLQKVSKAQKEAVDKFYGTDNVKAFFDGPASGELVKAVAIVVTPIVLAALAKRGYEFTKEEIGESVDSIFNLIPEFSFDPTLGLKDKVSEAILNIPDRNKA